MSSGWTNYTSGSDSEDERQASRILFDPRLVAQMSPQERLHLDSVRARLDREARVTHTAQRLVGELRATQGGQIATSTFRAFNGKAHRLVDGGSGIVRDLWAI